VVGGCWWRIVGDGDWSLVVVGNGNGTVWWKWLVVAVASADHGDRWCWWVVLIGFDVAEAMVGQQWVMVEAGGGVL